MGCGMSSDCSSQKNDQITPTGARKQQQDSPPVNVTSQADDQRPIPPGRIGEGSYLLRRPTNPLSTSPDGASHPLVEAASESSLIITAGTARTNHEEVADNHDDMPQPPASLRSKLKGLEQLKKKTHLAFFPETKVKELVEKADLRAILKEKAQLDGTAVNQVIKFIRQDAFKVFAILVWNERIDLIKVFFDCKFGDKALPVKILTDEQKDDDWRVIPWNKTFKVKIDNSVGDVEVAMTNFCNWQWFFTAPVFVEDKFDYEFHPSTRLPFLEPSRGSDEDELDGQGGFGEVHEKLVCSGHLKTDIKVTFDSQGHARVALKELKELPNIQQVAKDEAQSLQLMRRLGHDHIIKSIAHYERDGKHYFLFPWADKGNLWQFWRTHHPRLEKKGYITSVITQLAGLANAIKHLHLDMEEMEQQHCRHGDLKPQNILCFTESDKRGSSSFLKLIIADVGLARVHNEATAARTHTRAPTTIMYEAPEIELTPKKARSRRFDIWSMGCIYLEFVVWLLYGYDILLQFRDDRESSKFYVINESLSKNNVQRRTAEVHHRVRDWIKLLREVEPRCQENTALGCLVELIDTRLLVVDLEHDPNEVEIEVMDPVAKHKSSQQPSSNHPIPGIIVRPGTVAVGTEDSNSKNRAKADEMAETLEQILRDLDSNEIKELGPPGKTPPTVPPPSSNARKSSLAIPKLKGGQLDDDWDYVPDDEFARTVFRELDSTALIPQNSPATLSILCRRCRGLRLWDSAYQFNDTLDGLTEKIREENCELCGLLQTCAQKRGVNHDKDIKFVRRGSHLAINGSYLPVVSLYTTPDSKSASLKSIQIGLPKLSAAGSPVHVKVLSGWIQSCDNTHKCYPTQRGSFVPTRLLDIGGGDSNTVRLVARGKGERRYIALSHRWGSPKHDILYCTYKSNIEMLRGGIPISGLPMAFQDAITITRTLGLEYIWIDSLCIIQDDPEDWETESKFMERVFSSAYLTIAASCSSGSSDGFLKPRPDRGCVVMQGPRSARYYLSEAIDDFSNDVDQSELNQRGWVLQERALSRRTIYFTEKQTYWECGAGVRCETMTRMSNRKASFLGDANFPHSVDNYVKGLKIKLVQDLYERYSRLALTYPSDKPSAIKGLENRLIETLGTTGGFGVFDIYLHHCLLWQRSGSRLERIGSSRGAYVPSWSWMGYDGSISYMNVPLGGVSWRDDVKSPFAKIAKGGIQKRHEIGGFLQIMSSNALAGEYPDLEASVWDMVESVSSDTTVLDDPELGGSPPELRFAVIGRSRSSLGVGPQPKYYGMVVKFLAHDGDGVEVFERVGVAVLEGQHLALDGAQRKARIR